MRSLAVILASASLTLAAAAHASPVCPNGDIATLRASMLTPSGTMAGLTKAVADHQQWYRAHGYADRILLAPVLTMGPGGLARSPNQAITFHLRTVEVPRDKHDAGWDAFVAEYRANSTVTNETTVCYPH
jgi:hypothetical protein